MKRITKFILTLISVGSILSIATLNVSQFAVVGQPIPNINDKPRTASGGPRFVQPTDDPLLGDRERTTRRVGNKCVKGNTDITALVPNNKIGRTVSEYPVFFFYLPETDAQQAEFVLQDENDNLIYQTTLKINNAPGVTSVSMPDNKNVSALQVGQHYRWSISLICDTQDRSTDIFAAGIVRRVELSADIRSQLEKADPRQKAVIYAQNGIWQDALSTLAAARRANPNDAELAADWKILLDSVKLDKIAPEPIVQIQPEP